MKNINDWEQELDELFEELEEVHPDPIGWEWGWVQSEVELVIKAERERVKKAVLEKLTATYGVDSGPALVVVESDEMGGGAMRPGLSEVKRIVEVL